MSEPVGNGPRQGPSNIPAIPSNSHRSREEAPSSPEGRPKMEKVIEGKVVIKKPSVWKRISSSIIADDAKSVGDYVIEDVFVPALKNLLYDIVVGGAQRTLFGGRVRGTGLNYGGRVGPGPISNILGGGIRAKYEPIPEARYQLPHEDRATHNFDNMVIPTADGARSVVQSLIDRCHRYNLVTVADLYDAMGVTGSFADQRHGWTNLTMENADIRQVPGGFVLRLPRPQPLR